MIRMRYQATVCAALLMISFAGMAATPAGVDPEADRVLRAMTSYLAGLQQFSASTENTIEAVTKEGQKIQFIVPATLTVSRPDKLFSERQGDIVNQKFYYDGKSLTLYNPKEAVYATVPAPGTLDAMLDFARTQLDIVAPAADLINTHAYDRLMQDVTAGKYLGLAEVGGHRCHHLAYRAGAVDWQLWVREGKQPIPCRYVITTLDVAGAPEFTMQVIDWNSEAKPAPGLFDFKAPAGAQGIEFLKASKGAP